jgi:recombination protein U
VINYPNKKSIDKKEIINKDRHTVNRGMLLEDMLNATNEYYLRENIACIHKKPTPIKILKTTKESAYQVIEKAHFLSHSTTDYNGIYLGKYIDFEAKETQLKSFPLKNISEVQIQHLKTIMQMGGIGFVVIYFKFYNAIYLLDAKLVCDIWDKNEKSIPFSFVQQNGHLIVESYLIPLDYLKIVREVFIK